MDLLETYRHLQSDPTIPDERQARAAERMKDVWAKLGKIQDPDAFTNHLTEHIRDAYNARHNHGDRPDLERRAKPLCRCTRSRHVCEVKRGEVPSKVRTLDLTYIETSDTRSLAQSYVEEHTGDVVVGEAIEEFRGLRADIYSEVNELIVMLRSGRGATDSGDVEGPDAPRERPSHEPGPNHSVGREADDDPRASADGGTADDDPTGDDDGGGE